jgi:CRISPR/Cas system CMR subunit Cmr4 (Cas7 group RAMP superfamily)
MSTEQTNKIPSNRYDVAVNSLGDAAQKINLPKEINENEKHLIHIALITSRHNKRTLQTTFKTQFQMYNLRSWINTSKNLNKITGRKVVVFHDPRVKDGKQEQTQAQQDAKLYRAELVEKAKGLGYNEALNVKNSVFEAYIKEKTKEA